MQAEVKPEVPKELLQLRESIDQIDDELLELLARRFEITAQVGQLKAAYRLESVDSVRELEKLQRLHSLAVQHGLNTDFVRSLFQHIFDEVVKNHRSCRTGGGQGH
jgi:chorismate mutase